MCAFTTKFLRQNRRHIKHWFCLALSRRPISRVTFQLSEFRNCSSIYTWHDELFVEMACIGGAPVHRNYSVLGFVWPCSVLSRSKCVPLSLCLSAPVKTWPASVLFDLFLRNLESHRLHLVVSFHVVLSLSAHLSVCLCLSDSFLSSVCRVFSLPGIFSLAVSLSL